MIPAMILQFCLAVIIYTYIGYPLVLLFLAFFCPKRELPEMEDWPKISVLMAVHNEAERIHDAIRNNLENGYPHDKIELIVCSDGSTDDTNALVQQYEDPRVRLAVSPEQIGVNEVVALGAKQATGDIFLLTHAKAAFEPGAIQRLARLFADPKMGVATGRILYRNPLKSSVGSGYTAYWSIETRVRELESRLGIGVVVVGAFEMIRREAYLPVPSQYNNDMIAPTYACSKGFRAGFDKDALLVATQKKSPTEEFARRLRMAIRGWSSVPYTLSVIPFFSSLKCWFALISHKYLRWSTWAFMMGAFIANGLLWSFPVFRALFILQVVFYAMAAAGWLLARMRIRIRLLSMPFYFCLLQVAGMVGLIQALCGKRLAVWKPVNPVD